MVLEKTKSIQITGRMTAEYQQILSSEALEFVATLTRAFRERRNELLQNRYDRQASIDAGEMPSLFGCDLC